MPAITSSVHKLWKRMAWTRLLPLTASLHYPKQLAGKAHAQLKTGVKAAYVMRDNVLHRRDIEDAYLSAINHAKSEIIIANAYFVPGARFRQALLDAAKRGVTVKLLLQGRMEYFLMFAAHAFYSEFLQHNIEILRISQKFYAQQSCGNR